MNINSILTNSLYLVIRLVLVSLANLYIVRLSLDILGETDYGIYSVVAGIVLFANVFSGTLGASTTRFFSYYIGRKDFVNLNYYLSNFLSIFLLFSGIVSLLFYLIGPFFIKKYLNIPVDRINESVWLFYISMFSFSFNLFKIPFNSLIIAFEKFNFYALIGIAEVILKIGMIYSLIYIESDKLLLFGILNSILAFVLVLLYFIYVFFNVKSVNVKLGYNKGIVKEIVSFSGWTLIGTTSSIVNTQGLNIVINIYFGPVVSAARAISLQLYQSIMNFSNNAYSSFRPVIIKEYSKGELKNSIKLVTLSSKAVFIVLVIPIVLLFNYTEEFLTLWLGNISDTMIILTKLILIIILFDSLANPLNTINSASGKISLYQLYVGIFKMLSLPASFIFYELGFKVETLYYVLISISIISVFLRVEIIKKQNSLNLNSYKLTFFRFLLTIIIIYFFGLYLKSLISINFYFYFLIYLICSMLICFFVVLSKNDMSRVLTLLKKKK